MTICAGLENDNKVQHNTSPGVVEILCFAFCMLSFMYALHKKCIPAWSGGREKQAAKKKLSLLVSLWVHQKSPAKRGFECIMLLLFRF